MRRLTVRRVKSSVVGFFVFVGNVAYYLRQGHYPSMAVSLARDTLPS